MTIRRGRSWGESAVPNTNAPVATSDSEALRVIQSGGREIVLSGGDMARTLGVHPRPTGSGWQRLTIDLLRITSFDSAGAIHIDYAMSHCVVRSSWWRGGYFRGEVFFAANGQYFKGLDIAPRGHPNDGLFENVILSASLSGRQRLLARSKARLGNHLPHPGIGSRSVATCSTSTPGILLLDGVSIGHRDNVSIDIDCDALIIWIVTSSEAISAQD